MNSLDLNSTMTIMYRPLLSLSFVLLALCSQAEHTYRMVIRMNFNDCINCTSALGFVQQLPEEVAIVVMVEKSNRNITPDFLAQHGVDPGSVTIKVMDHPSTEESSFDFRVDKRSVISAPLKELHASIAFVLGVVEVGRPFRSLRIESHPVLSDRVTYSWGNDRCIVTDYVTGRCFKIASTAMNTWTSIEVRFDEALAQELRDSLHIDPAMYEYVLPILDQMGKRGIRIKSAFPADSAEYFGLSLTLPFVEGNGDTALADINVIAKVRGDDIERYWFVNTDVNERVADHAFDIDDGFVVESDSTFAIPLFRSDVRTDTTFLLARANCIDGRLVHNRMGALTRPQFYDAMGYGHDFSNIGMSRDLIFMRSYPKIASISEEWSCDLRKVVEAHFQQVLGDRSFPFYFVDWRIVRPGLCGALVINKGKEYALFIDVIGGRVVFSSPLGTQDVALGSVRFKSDGGLSALSADGRYVLLSGGVRPNREKVK